MLHAGPVYIEPSLNSLSFGISEFHLRMRQICRPKLYNYPFLLCKSLLSETLTFYFKFKRNCGFSSASAFTSKWLTQYTIDILRCQHNNHQLTSDSQTFDSCLKKTLDLRLTPK
jgi:hypothetical protein